MTYNQLRKMNNRKHKTLSKINDYKMSDMAAYIRSLDISNYQAELLRACLLDILQQAEIEDKKPETVIGNDYKRFINALAGKLPPSSRGEVVLDRLRLFAPALVILTALKVLTALGGGLIRGLSGGPFSPVVTITAGDLALLLVVTALSLAAVAFLAMGSPKSTPPKSSGRPGDPSSQGIPVILGAVLFLTGLSLYLFAGDTVLFRLPAIAAVVTPILIYLIFKVIEGVLANKTEGYAV